MPSRFVTEIPDELLRVVSGRRERAPGSGRPDRLGRAGGGRREAWREAQVEQALRAAPEPSAGPGASELPVGADVRHPAWGVGVVVDASGSGDDAEVTVRFPEAGEKRLLVAWAPLERVGP